MSVKVVAKPDEEPPPAEIIAQAIIDIAEGMKKIARSRLKREAVITLIHDNSKVAKGTIRIVLNNLDDLENTWLKAKPLPPMSSATKK